MLYFLKKVLAIKTNLYFIAIIPGEKVIRELTSFKQDFAGRFESKKALRIIPHITLKIPFHVAADQHEKLIKWFESLSLTEAPFTIELNGFGAFNRKQVIYVKPAENLQLNNLQKELIGLIRNRYPDQVETDDEQFSPHMTIAYRDLSKQKFQEAWKEYENKSYNASFEVNEINLLEHDGSWRVVGICRLK